MHEVGGRLKNWEELSPGLPKCKLGVLTTHMNFGSLNKTHAVIVFDPAREIFQMCIQKETFSISLQLTLWYVEVLWKIVDVT
jgi:hypothetical protein